MKNQIRLITVFTLLLILFTSCGNSDLDIQVEKLDGYWEIKSVSMPDGSVKEFKVNTSVEYIQVEGDSGVRKKLIPQFDGTYKDPNLVEKFDLIQRNDSLIIFYKTPYSYWEEAVLEISDSTMVVQNNSNTKYTYKRFKTINVLD